MRRKRTGSALITVLAITIVLLALGSAIVTSIIATTKSNANHNEDKDLQYAAESGIEIARSYFTTQEGKDGKIDTINDSYDKALVRALKKGIVKEVELTSRIDPLDENKIIITSQAFHKNNRTSKIVECKLKKKSSGGINNIFDYGGVAGEGNLIIENGASTNIDSDLVAKENINIDIISGVNTGNREPNKDTIGELKFKNSEFIPHIIYKPSAGFYKKNILGLLEKIDISELSMNFNDEFIKNENTQKEINFVDLNKEENKLSSVIRLKIKGVGPHDPVTLILINSDFVEVNQGDIAISSHIILNKGKLEVLEKGSLHLTWSTLYSSAIKINKGSSITMTGEAGNTEVLNDSNAPHGIPRENYPRLNEIISKFISDWGTNSEESGTGDFELDDNPYS